MENFKNYFHKVSEDELEEAKKGIGNYRAIGSKIIEGEIEKSPEFLKIIDKINEYIQEEIKELGIEPRESLDPKKLHIINNDIAKMINLDSDGAYRSDYDSMFLNKDRFDSEIGMYELLLHETIHYYGYGAIMALGELKQIKSYRSGYTVKNSIEIHDHFMGFNEAVVEKILLEILNKHKTEIVALSSKKEEDVIIDKKFSHYQDNIDILELYIEKIAEKENIKPEEIWKEIKKGEFTGELMHLRKIEKHFGSGALRILSAFGNNGSLKRTTRDDWFEKVKKYFTSENQEERNKIAKELLVERERLNYEKNSKKPYNPI